MSGICHTEYDVNHVNLGKVSYSSALLWRGIVNLPEFTYNHRFKSTWHVHVDASHLWEEFPSEILVSIFTWGIFP